MDARRHHRVKELFAAAHALSPAERARLCEREVELGHATRAELDELLAAHDAAGPFLERGVVASDGAARMDEVELPLPERIGGFRIRELLAHGGMGVVYLAEQENPRRAVALKVLRRDAASVAARKRFEREARVLARLHHPGIAQIYAAGVERTEAGAQPWIALEYVRGANLIEHAERERLPLHARLVLVAEACDALEHAHRQGIVHRDLKPSNVLVDEHGRVKVLDFGIATFAGDDGGSFATQPGQLLGTLAYMSPEQARGEPVDGRADVYALGVLLYELVAGHPPHSTRGLLPHEAVRTLCEEEPTALCVLRPELGRDLGTIVSKALEKDARRRYADAAELGADVRRFLDHRPITARPSSRAYQLAKLVRRHRGIAAGIALTFVVLVLGIVGVTLALRRALVAEADARAERDVTTRLSDRRGLDVLERRADLLWPATSRTVPELDAWLLEADTIVERWPGHLAYLAELDARAAAVEPSISEEPSASVRAERSRQVELLDALAEFARDGGVLSRVRARRESARSLAHRTLDEHRADWRATIAAIADRACAPAYRGLVIEPQEGLVPLGPDPASGLFEFALADATGRVPRRDPTTGRLELDEDTGVVLVLLPGGPFTQGWQALSPSLPNYAAIARDWEGPPRAVELAPFFVSKYELTQGQWTRVSGSNPSMWEPGSVAWLRRNTALHPVENVSWEDAMRVLERIELGLPTEAQWEFAAADAGAGDGPPGRSSPLLGHANFCGREEYDRAALGAEGCFDPLKSDGWVVHSPVGSFRPNRYGLFDVIGNVWELCADVYCVHASAWPTEPGTGRVRAEDDGHRPRRGGSYSDGPDANSVSFRADVLATSREPNVGVRPVRALHGAWRCASETDAGNPPR